MAHSNTFSLLPFCPVMEKQNRLLLTVTSRLKLVVGGFVQQTMLEAVVQYCHINAAREHIGGHAAVVLEPHRQKKFCLEPFCFGRGHGSFFVGSRNTALLIDELHGVRKFHIFNFDKVLQRIDAAHFVMRPPTPFSVGDFQTVVAAELVRSGAGGNEFIRLVSPEKGQQVRLTGALDLRFGCVGHG